ncbi:MAG: hypothetical protein FJ102_19840 [Deltaproteobacteria bacterium]|nr:hypothetical protein [Deltaproteobacteria bacterium]
MFTLLAAMALADTITLDSGAIIEGDLARYEMGGDCQVSVTEGPLVGVIVIVPCHRVLAFVRTAPVDAPVLAAVVAPEIPVVEVPVDEPLAPPIPDFMAEDEVIAEESDVAEIEADEGAGDPPVEEESRSPGRDAIAQPREAPVMPSVTTRALSF